MRRACFWVAVGGVAVLANLAVEVAANRLSSPGLSRFTAMTHYGAGVPANG